MKSLYSHALAAGLVAIAALLVGFQGATTVMTIVEYGAKAKPSDARMVSLHTDRHAREASKPAVAPPAQAETRPTEMESPETQAIANPSGVAAAAKANALAEIAAMERAESTTEKETARPRRTYRLPRADKHRVY